MRFCRKISNPVYISGVRPFLAFEVRVLAWKKNAAGGEGDSAFRRTPIYKMIYTYSNVPERMDTLLNEATSRLEANLS
jgi:hypothetical protein